MRLKFILPAVCISLCFHSYAQDGMLEAFKITRMMSKFHVQPKPVNDSLSSVTFDNFFKQMDPYKIVFTREDIDKFNSFRYKLDDDIQNKRSLFLITVKPVFIQRTKESDSLVNLLVKSGLNFTVDETTSESEQETFAGNNSKKNKLSKFLKAEILSSFRDEVRYDSTLLNHKNKIDSFLRRESLSLGKRFKQMFQLMLNGPSTVDELLTESFCEALANAYDPHSDYFTQTQKKQFEHELGNKDYDYGFSVDENEEGEVDIDEIRPGSSAFTSGQLSKGDKIRAIRWEGGKNIDVSDASAEELSNMLAAGNEKPVTLVIKKADGTIKEVTLAKSETDEEDEDIKVRSFVLSDKAKVGYIALPAFYSDWENESNNVNGCANDVAKEIIKLKKENIEALILDLRYNGGGSIQEATELAGIFIDAGPVGQIKTKEPKPYVLRDVNRGTVYDGPLFVLVNRYSASASELLAAVLQDYKRAVIVGAPTYGKATGQLVMPLDTALNIEDEKALNKQANSYMKITTITVYRISGETAQGKGVIPDISISEFLPENDEKESSNPLYLRTTAIEPNKYYKPLPDRYTAVNLQNEADEEIKKDKFFEQLNAYEQKRKSAANAVSLNINTIVTALKNASNNGSTFKQKTDMSSFRIESTALEQQREKLSTEVSAMNTSLKVNILSDPYIGVVFRTIQRLKK